VPISSQKVSCDTFYLRKYNIWGKNTLQADSVRMSFQHFRLGDHALHQPIQHNLHSVHHQQPPLQHSTPQHQHISSQSIPGQSQFTVQIQNPITTFSVSLKKDAQQPPPQQPSPQQQQPSPKPQQHSKQPYGSGDADDGYTLVFASLQEFNDWRQAEEGRTMCEFVKVRANFLTLLGY